MIIRINKNKMMLEFLIILGIIYLVYILNSICNTDDTWPVETSDEKAHRIHIIDYKYEQEFQKKLQHLL